MQQVNVVLSNQLTADYYNLGRVSTFFVEGSDDNTGTQVTTASGIQAFNSIQTVLNWDPLQVLNFTYNNGEFTSVANGTYLIQASANLLVRYNAINYANDGFPFYANLAVQYYHTPSGTWQYLNASTYSSFYHTLPISTSNDLIPAGNATVNVFVTLNAGEKIRFVLEVFNVPNGKTQKDDRFNTGQLGLAGTYNDITSTIKTGSPANSFIAIKVNNLGHP